MVQDPNGKRGIDVSLLTDAAVVVTIFTGLIAQVVLLRDQFEALLGQRQLTVTLFSIIAAIVLVSWIVIRPRLHKYRKSQQLAKILADTKVLRVRHFRLSPYTSSKRDQKDFFRLDDFHEVVLEWLRDSSDALLYLTGRSGVGKTSLLDASVLPRLPNTTFIKVRSYGDPLKQLRARLVTAGNVWSQPPNMDDESIDTVLNQACKYVQNKNQTLLLVFDQFEELTVIHDRYPECVKDVISLLRKAVEVPIVGLKILLVVRSDYVGKLHSLKLPLLALGKNHEEIPPFTVPASIEFLVRGKVDPPLASHLVRQASEIENTPGLIRPITLNMLGVIIDRSPTALSRTVNRRSVHGGLLGSQLKEWLDDPIVKDDAPRLLSLMITSHGTKEPRSLHELALETGLPTSDIEGCLVALTSNGIVRRVDDETGVWEISHDFLARLIERILATPARSLHPAIPWAALALWIVLVVFGAVAGFYVIGRGRVTAAGGILRSQQLRVPFSGLTLDTYLHEAMRPGAFQGTDPDDFAQIFVVLMRGSTRMFIPLALVQNNRAGSIQLRHGDHIEVLDIEDVGLFDDRLNPNDPNSPSIPAGTSFQWSGLVSNPGRFTTTRDAQRLKDDPPEFFGNLLGRADVLVLTRQNATLTDEFVIPEGDRRFGQFWRIDRRILLRDGDRIVATSLENALPMLNLDVGKAHARSTDVVAPEVGLGAAAEIEPKSQ